MTGNAFSERLRLSEESDSSLSTKACEHLKLTQFIQREWQHLFLSLESVGSMILAIKKQLNLSVHPKIDTLARLYDTAVQHPQNAQAFDAFYEAAMQIQKEHGIESPLHEWVNVTMNVWLNLLLDGRPLSYSHNLINPLNSSQALVHWLNHLMTQKNGVRALLTQQLEQASSFDHTAWRCQLILHALEGHRPNQEYIRGTGMQKLLRTLCQNNNPITTTNEQKAKDVPINALCQHSITMQHALDRVKAKIPKADLARPFDLGMR